MAKNRITWDKRKTHELFRRYKEQGDEAAREELIVNHLNLVRFLAGKFANRGENLEDLVQVGCIGLIKAIDRFEPERGLEFTTYATPTILGEIKRHFRDKGWSVRVPRRLQELSSRVNKTNDELTERLKRSPKVEEIAKELGVTTGEVLEAMESSSAYTSIPLEAGSVGDEGSAAVIDRFGVEDKMLAGSDNRMIIQEAVGHFTQEEQEIIKLRFVDGLTQVEIAQKLGVSQVHVSRFIRKILQKLKLKLDPDAVVKTPAPKHRNRKNEK